MSEVTSGKEFQAQQPEETVFNFKGCRGFLKCFGWERVNPLDLVTCMQSAVPAF